MWRVATGRSRLIGRIGKSLQTSLAALNVTIYDVTNSVSKKVKHVKLNKQINIYYCRVFVHIHIAVVWWSSGSSK